MIQPLTGILMMITLAETIGVMALWHVWTAGMWRRHLAGRAVMTLLAVISAILTLATVSAFFPTFEGRGVLYIIAYCLLILAMGGLGLTINAEQNKTKHHEK